jgi:NAD-dependent DNA ligase
VETQMAALDQPGTPVSVLIDHGLSERLAEKLVSDGHTTVEPLANMTREEIEAIPGIGTEMADDVIIALNAYYAPYVEHPEQDQPVEGDQPEQLELAEGENVVEAEAETEPSPETGEFAENTTVPVGESDTISEMK